MRRKGSGRDRGIYHDQNDPCRFKPLLWIHPITPRCMEWSMGEGEALWFTSQIIASFTRKLYQIDLSHNTA